MKKNEYLRLRKKLIVIANSIGVSFSISKGKFRRQDMFGCSGSYSSLNKKINLRTHGNCSYLEILATLAHEVRHAIHHNQGLFPGYYIPMHETKEYWKKLKSGTEPVHDTAEGQAAEDDCNLFAREWLANEGYPLDPNKKSYADYSLDSGLNATQLLIEY